MADYNKKQRIIDYFSDKLLENKNQIYSDFIYKDYNNKLTNFFYNMSPVRMINSFQLKNELNYFGISKTLNEIVYHINQEKNPETIGVLTDIYNNFDDKRKQLDVSFEKLNSLNYFYHIMTLRKPSTIFV
ncbi:hypothetical protein ACFL1H_01850 [Nanoarchaeota archaeon]